MKIQHLAIIFIMIILPISMVISYYVNAQIQTINQQELYDAKLVTATYDSVKSFQLNTINNKYSAVSDSKMRDIEAGISSFFNSLGTELGATGYNRIDLNSYIPAIVYSMYDGYYVYGKYYDDSLDNGDGTYGDYRIGLKPYVYYACRYKKGNSDFVVNYTLDNTITIYGKVNGKNASYSGALINLDKVSDIETKKYKYYSKYDYYNNDLDLKEVTYANSAVYKGVTIKPEVLTEKLLIAEPDGSLNPVIKEYQYLVYNDQKIYVEENDDGSIARNENDIYWYVNNDGNRESFKGIRCFLNYKGKKQYIPKTDIETMTYMNVMIYPDYEGGLEKLHSNSASQYISDAFEFSTWVNDNLSGISQEDACEYDGNQIKDFDTNTENKPIFKLKGNKTEDDPTNSESVFNENRICVIKRSIKSNLTAEMANFSTGSGYDCKMPFFTEDDWDKIVNNMCVSVFMQGVSIGMKYYNNYCIVPNDKNKEVVTEDSIYIITDDEEAHYPGCEELVKETKNPVSAYKNIDFERQTVVDYNSSSDEGYQNYSFYPHDNRKSYECVVNAKGIYDVEDIINDKYYTFEGEEKVYDNSKHVSADLRRVYITALLREKYDLYRTNGYFGVPIEE